ncbi:helix-turn-helix domain-containing protein [Streptomyces mobaraensis]|uniref:TetR/AcrR family transcriptional regulator n=1 Tax=Streptomyces mobaraensis TaxID=35621 RepID=UPI003330A7A4
MARPARFTENQLLDAAVRLAATHGPAGVTMSAVAKETGAPSGSVYHRFPHRAALLAEVWLRTMERFQDGYLAALATGEGPLDAGRRAARHVVAWSRAHPAEAALLLHGPGEFGRGEWSDEHVRRADLGTERVRAAVAAVAAALGADSPCDAERVGLALIDLPLSVVRRHLRPGAALPDHAEDLAVRCAEALLF